MNSDSAESLLSVIAIQNERQSLTAAFRHTEHTEADNMAKNNDPTLQEIAERAAAIRAEWSAEESWKRLRPDLRPHYRNITTGETVEMSSATYHEHHSGGIQSTDYANGCDDRGA